MSRGASSATRTAKTTSRKSRTGRLATRTSYTLVHDKGVRQGRISLNRMVELMSTNAAKCFGLYPKKGTIAAGSDADIVIFDPEREHVLSAKTHHMATDYNLYEGTRVMGSPELVIARGKVIVEDDRFVGKPGSGVFLKRARYGEKLLNPAGHTMGR